MNQYACQNCGCINTPQIMYKIDDGFQYTDKFTYVIPAKFKVYHFWCKDCGLHQDVKEVLLYFLQ